MFFLDASTEVHGVTLIIKSILKNNKAIHRLLMNKIKLKCPQAGTILRKELAAAHLTGRIKEVVCNFQESMYNMQKKSRCQMPNQDGPHRKKVDQ